MVMNFKTILAYLIIILSSQFSIAAQKEWKVINLVPVIDTKQEIKLTPDGWVM